MRTALVCALAASAMPALAQPGDIWAEIASRESISLPAPLDTIEWRTDLPLARREARLTNRPLFVTLRCLPCKQCADFDAAVLEGGDDLTPLLRQFITVRLTDAAQIDLSLLPAPGYQDFDLSWWGYFLAPDGSLYGVFGGKDHVSENTRISELALANTMRRVLHHHYDPRREAWAIDRPAPSAAPTYPAALPGYESWRKQALELSSECIHCHQVGEILRQPAIDAGAFDPAQDLDMWPLPENVGITLDRDHGLRIAAVEPDSPAARVGLQAGDQLLAAEDQRLFGQADFRGVLHRSADPAGDIHVRWTRGLDLHAATLTLEPGWRTTQYWWRASVSGGNIGCPPGFWPLKGPRDGVAPGTMSVKPWFGQNPRATAPRDAGLRGHHVIIAVNGQSPDIFAREFQTWFRLRHNRGDEVTLTVLDNGQRREIRYVLPD